MKKIKLLTPILTGTLVASSLISVTSCNTMDINTITNQLVETTVAEFKSLAKHPRPSQGLVEISTYLKNWITSHGWTFMEDQSGNIWFDVPATSGKEKMPKAILQGHMDMVFEYDKSQTVEGAGTKPVPDPLTHMIEIVEDKDDDNRPILHSKDYFTSIGADDGIGIAMIMAIVTNPNLSHGPLRALFTTDEELGLIGAKGLSKVALEGCDFLLNFDGEGKKGAEDIICTGCQGYCEYQYKKEFAKDTAGSLGTTFSMEISGLEGGHCMDETWITYKGDGISNVGANADKIALTILQAIIDSGSKVQICSYRHYDEYEKEVSYKANQLTKAATVIFNTNYTNDPSVINTLIGNVINDSFKAYFPHDDWTKVKMNAKGVETTPSSWLSDADSANLINLFGKTIPCYILQWEGKDDQEKKDNNYPLKTSNISTFKVIQSGEKMLFTIGTRGCAGQNSILDDLRKNLYDDVIKSKVFDEQDITVVKDYYPWDTSTYHKLVDATKAAFESFGVTPVLEKTRGGVEPCHFSTAKPGLEQLVIGPRIDTIHNPKETLYVDTIFNPMKASIIVLQHLHEIK